MIAEITTTLAPTANVSPLWTPMLFSGEFLTYAIIFFVLAIIASLVGARGVAGITMEIARWFIIIFIVLAIITLIL